MNKERIQAFVAALRSDKYKKGRYVLKETTLEGVDRFCAEGVFCDVTGVGEWLPFKNKKGTTYLYKTKSNLAAGWISAGQDDDILGWYGLEQPLRIFGMKKVNPYSKVQEHDRISYFNDHEGWSFKDIADAIEEQYLK